MGKRIYLDTNIYLDYLLERKNKQGDDLESKAFRIFQRTISCEFQIVMSGWLIDELKKYVLPEQVYVLFEMLKKKTIKIEYDDSDFLEAKRYSSHYHDILHGLLALKGGAEYIVTRDLKGFININHLIKTKKPEEL